MVRFLWIVSKQRQTFWRQCIPQIIIIFWLICMIWSSKDCWNGMSQINIHILRFYKYNRHSNNPPINGLQELNGNKTMFCDLYSQYKIQKYWTLPRVHSQRIGLFNETRDVLRLENILATGQSKFVNQLHGVYRELIGFICMRFEIIPINFTSALSFELQY